MKIKKIIITFLCLFLISSITLCAEDNKIAAGNMYLDEKVYDNKNIREILHLSKNQSVEYAGKYFDKAGILNIKLVYNSVVGIKREEFLDLIDSINGEGKIRFQDAKFSYVELKNACNILSARMVDSTYGGIVSVGIDETKNRVDIIVSKLNDKIKNNIGKIVDISLIEIREGAVVPV